MHTTARMTVRVGAFAAVLAVLAASTPAGRAAAQDVKSAPGQASPDKKYAFEFDKRPWREVFEWLSDRTGLPLITSIYPTGTFSFVAPKPPGGGRMEYTIPQIIDILNESLVKEKRVGVTSPL